MFTGSLIMCPVAYDALSTGISGRTFARPIASAPPRDGVRSQLQTRSCDPAVRRRDDSGAPQARELAQVVEVRVPAPITQRRLRSQPQRVVVSFDQLVDELGQLLRLVHQPATAADSPTSIGTGSDSVTGGP